MYRRGIEGFPYYVGIHLLAEVATRDDRVCVLNILGGESRQVTPTSDRIKQKTIELRRLLHRSTAA